MKICGKCKQNKENICFGPSKQTLDGLKWQCKECRKKEYYKNHEKMLEMKRLDYKKHKKSRLKKDKEKYYLNHELTKKKRRENYTKNKEKILKQNKEYRNKNRNTILKKKQEYEQKRRDKIKQEKLLLESQIITVKYPETHRICGKCKTLKSNNSYRIKANGKLITWCKTCEKEHNKFYYQKNQKILSEKDKQRRLTKCGQEYQKFRRKRYNQSKIGQGKIKEYKSRPNVKIADSCRSRLYSLIKLYNLKKEKRTFEYIGCNIEFLINYIQSQFVSKMTWENYGEWHIDHIKPCCSFDLTKQEEIHKCFHYSNLRPLWGKENLSKASKDKELSIF